MGYIYQGYKVFYKCPGENIDSPIVNIKIFYLIIIVYNDSNWFEVDLHFSLK